VNAPEDDTTALCETNVKISHRNPYLSPHYQFSDGADGAKRRVPLSGLDLIMLVCDTDMYCNMLDNRKDDM
jgi:hypothetical protein